MTGCETIPRKRPFMPHTSVGHPLGSARSGVNLTWPREFYLCLLYGSPPSRVGSSPQGKGRMQRPLPPHPPQRMAEHRPVRYRRRGRWSAPRARVLWAQKVGHESTMAPTVLLSNSVSAAYARPAQRLEIGLRLRGNIRAQHRKDGHAGGGSDVTTSVLAPSQRHRLHYWLLPVCRMATWAICLSGL